MKSVNNRSKAVEGELRENKPISNTPLLVSMYLPQLEKHTVRIATANLSTPCADFNSESQSLTVSSSEQDTTSLLSGENAAELTERVWPLRVPHGAPAVFQSLMVVSAEQEISSLPSDENATEFTIAEWPVRVREATSVETSHSLTVASAEHDATKRLSFGENETSLTVSECPSSLHHIAPVPTCQSMAVLSVEHEARNFPSDENRLRQTLSE